MCISSKLGTYASLRPIPNTTALGIKYCTKPAVGTRPRFDALPCIFDVLTLLAAAFLMIKIVAKSVSKYVPVSPYPFEDKDTFPSPYSLTSKTTWMLTEKIITRTLEDLRPMILILHYMRYLYTVVSGP